MFDQRELLRKTGPYVAKKSNASPCFSASLPFGIVSSNSFVESYARRLLGSESIVYASWIARKTSSSSSSSAALFLSGWYVSSALW